jgi:hypothetical protein
MTMPVLSKPKGLARYRPSRTTLLQLMWVAFVGSVVMFFLDANSIVARLLAILVAAIYLGDALASGRLYHYRLHREIVRKTSPLSYWSFVAVSFSVLIILVGECIFRIVAP